MMEDIVVYCPWSMVNVQCRRINADAAADASSSHHFSSRQIEGIRLSVVIPSAGAGSERRSTARQICQKEQNLSVRHQHVRWCWLGTALDGQTDKSKRKEFICLSSTRPLVLAKQKEQNLSVCRQHICC
jgi:hypothetical protein